MASRRERRAQREREQQELFDQLEQEVLRARAAAQTSGPERMGRAGTRRAWSWTMVALVVAGAVGMGFALGYLP